MPRKDRKRPASVVKAVGIVAGERRAASSTDDGKKAAQLLGQRGGKARARILSAERRKEIAQKGAAARWKT
jgi:hypothetical protein